MVSASVVRITPSGWASFAAASMPSFRAQPALAKPGGSRTLWAWRWKGSSASIRRMRSRVPSSQLFSSATTARSEKATPVWLAIEARHWTMRSSSFFTGMAITALGGLARAGPKLSTSMGNFTSAASSGRVAKFMTPKSRIDAPGSRVCARLGASSRQWTGSKEWACARKAGCRSFWAGSFLRIKSARDDGRDMPATASEAPPIDDCDARG